jgi:cytochrome c2
MMRFRTLPTLMLALLLAPVGLSGQSGSMPEIGRFFETRQPFFQTQVDVAAPTSGPAHEENFVVRGIVIPLAPDHALVFDQELLRLAGLWRTPLDHPPVTLQTMAQMSYVIPRRRAYDDHPRPTGPILLQSRMRRGVSAGVQPDFRDPRPPAREGDRGRGPLPIAAGRFLGVELADTAAILHYEVAGTTIREWHQARATDRESQFLRHLEVEPHDQPIHLVLGSPGIFVRQNAPYAASGWVVRLNHADAELLEVEGEQVIRLRPSTSLQRITIEHTLLTAPPAPGLPGRSRSPGGDSPRAAAPTPPRPVASGQLRWPGAVAGAAHLGVLDENGLILDRISVPEHNPWHRRVRAADLAFVDANQAAMVTYDGDVWWVTGLADPELRQLEWRRFASGLHEPLAMATPDGVIQVATKNGIVRLHDRDGNGEADWFENFNDHMIQSQTTRSFPLDMAVGPDGSTYVTQGGIVTQSGVPSGGSGTAHAGAVLRITPDGRSSELFADRAREPFLTVHPQTGIVTGTDQQGHYIPSSVVYLIRRGDSFGFLEDKPERLTPPLVWIPHEQDSSSSSQVWMVGDGLGPWEGKLLHLSYGTGRLFLIDPDLEAPIPQGAVIPLDLQTDLPLLHARVPPQGGSVFLAGFQIWGSRATTPWALGRLRPGGTPIRSALAARSVADGVILHFAEPLDPGSVRADTVRARAWNYVRSAEYGSGRYTLEGPPGTTLLGVAQAVLSADRRAVFVHLPDLPPVMQLELQHEFGLASGAPARGVAYLTIHQPARVDLAGEGFPSVDLSVQSTVALRQPEEPASVIRGREVAEMFGCLACHSTDGTSEGQIGPTWLNLYGSVRTFVDGTRTVADEHYLREKILDPLRRRVSLTQAEMPSYRGVVTDSQLDSLVLYIKSLNSPRPRP